MPPQPLARIIDQLKREPSRTGSIVITLFGDAIVPRGGAVALATLLEFFETLDINATVVRTAMSRLTADGWFERSKIGRNSFYRLVQKGRLTFDIATKHIYDPPPSDWTGRFELLLIGNAEDRDASRDALQNAGFGSPVPGVWGAPAGRGGGCPAGARGTRGNRRAPSGWKCRRRAPAAGGCSARAGRSIAP